MMTSELQADPWQPWEAKIKALTETLQDQGLGQGERARTQVLLQEAQRISAVLAKYDPAHVVAQASRTERP